MEYTDITMEMYTMDNGNKIRKMATDIIGEPMVTNYMDSSSRIRSRKTELNKKNAHSYFVKNKYGKLISKSKISGGCSRWPSFLSYFHCPWYTSPL
jgi:hypothetical protein